MLQFHWWAWPLLAVLLGGWLLLYLRPAVWRMLAFVRLDRVGPILHAERCEETLEGADYRAPPAGSGGPKLPELTVGSVIEPEATLRFVGPSLALVKAKPKRRRFGGGEVMGQITVEVVAGSDDTVHLDVRYAPPPGTLLLTPTMTVVVAMNWGQVTGILVVLPLVFGWQMFRGYEQHRDLVPWIEQRFTKLLRTKVVAGETPAWIWTDGARTSERRRSTEPRKGGRARRQAKAEGSSVDAG
jgi:hypothetical protein